jgi:imidazolonepropionase-like amidohydrolase
VRSRFVIVAILLALATAGASQTPSDGAAVVVRHASVVDLDTGTAAVRTVVARGGTIVAVGPDTQAVPAGATVVDGRGRYLLPGLWDMHIHLATRPEASVAERIILPLLLAHGVVGVRDMGGPAERVIALRAKVASGALEGPRIVTPGPFLDGPGDADAMFERVTAPDGAAKALSALATAGVDFFKVQAGLDPGVHRAIVTTAAARRAIVAGHVPLSMRAAEVAASGQRSIEHLSPALIGDAGLLFGCSKQEEALRGELLAIERERGTSTAAAIRDREAALRARLMDTYDPARARDLGALLARHEVWITPTLIWSNRLRPLARTDDGSDVPLQYVPAASRTRLAARRSDYLKAARQEDLEAAARVAEVSARALRDLHAGGARVLAGTDAFDGFVLPGVSLHQELALLVRAGLSPLQALRAATVEAARYFGDSKAGVIAPGMRADMVLLDGNPLADIANTTRIRAVVLTGRPYPRDRLDAMLNAARESAAR